MDKGRGLGRWADIILYLCLTWFFGACPQAKRGKASSSQEEGHYGAPPAPQDPAYASQYQEEGQEGGGGGMNEDYPMEDARVGPGYEQYESDDSQRSSPAMSSAALALASMFHGQQGERKE